MARQRVIRQEGRWGRAGISWRGRSRSGYAVRQAYERSAPRYRKFDGGLRGAIAAEKTAEEIPLVTFRAFA